MRLISTLLFTAFVPIGCWYAGRSNGGSGSLEFSVAGVGSKIAGVDLPFELSVIRYPEQWHNICTQSRRSNGLENAQIQGGDPCGSSGPGGLATTPIALTEAHCDDDACTVSDESSKGTPPTPAGSLLLRVTPKRAGAITVHVVVRAVDGSGAWGDSYGVSVDAVDRLAWLHPLPDDAPASYGVMPGTPAAWAPIALASDGTELAAAYDAFDTQWQGDAFAIGADGIARAKSAGTATVTISAAGKTKSESLRVFDPKDVRAIEVRKAYDGSAPGSLLNGVRTDVEVDVSQGGALASIDLDRTPFETGPFVLVLTLSDGARVLGGAQSLAIAGVPSTTFGPIVQRQTPEDYAWTFWLHTDGDSAGVPATLTAHVGQATLSLPLILVDDASDAGGGDAHAVDAGASDTGAKD